MCCLLRHLHSNEDFIVRNTLWLILVTSLNFHFIHWAGSNFVLFPTFNSFLKICSSVLQGALRFKHCCDEGVSESPEEQYFLWSKKLNSSSDSPSASVRYLSFFPMFLIFFMKFSWAILEGLHFLLVYYLDSYEEKKPMGFLIIFARTPVVVQSYFRLFTIDWY